MVLNCVFVPLTHLKPGILTTMQREEPKKYYEICNVDRNSFVRDIMENDPFYKEYVLEAIGELVEYLFKE